MSRGTLLECVGFGIEMEYFLSIHHRFLHVSNIFSSFLPKSFNSWITTKILIFSDFPSILLVQNGSQRISPYNMEKWKIEKQTKIMENGSKCSLSTLQIKLVIITIGLDTFWESTGANPCTPPEFSSFGTTFLTNFKLEHFFCIFFGPRES